MLAKLKYRFAPSQRALRHLRRAENLMYRHTGRLHRGEAMDAARTTITVISARQAVEQV